MRSRTERYAAARAITRRTLLTGVAAGAALPSAALAEALAATAAPSRIERLSYVSADGHGEIAAARAVPEGAGPSTPAVLVVHEDHGLTPYIERVLDALAEAGLVAMAPDGLSPLGGYPGDPAAGRALQQELDPARLMEDFFAGFDHLAADGAPGRRLAALGFGYGGGVAHAMALVFPELAAASSFYGRAPDPREAASVAAPLQLHFAEFDAPANAGWPAFEAALAAQGKPFEGHRYRGVFHGFHNPSAPTHDPVAAALAWSRTLAFLARSLG